MLFFGVDILYLGGWMKFKYKLEYMSEVYIIVFMDVWLFILL